MKWSTKVLVQWVGWNIMRCRSLVLRRGGLIALTLSLSMVTSAIAQSQVATVRSGSAFKLRGAKVTPSLVVPTWPVLPGDTISVGVLPVELSFPDGSTIVLSPGAKAVVNVSDGAPVLQLESESAHYTLVRLDAVRLYAKSDVVEPHDLVGDFSLGTRRQPAGWWTPKNAGLLIAGAATVAGVTIGLVTSNGPSVSPVR